MQKYSVLMTVYKNDNPEYFRQSLYSMFQQTYLPDEIVIVKDGMISNDLQQVINSYIGKNIRIQQVSLERNVGLGMALNAGIKKCSNELIARMDADDYSMPKRCELQIKEFEKDPHLDIVGCPADEFVGTIDNVVGCRSVPTENDEIYKFARKRDPFNHPTVMYKKSTVQKVGGYSNYRKNQDTDLWIKMLEENAKCKNLKEHVFRFRFDENTYQKRKSWINTKILIKIRYNAWKNGFNTFFDLIEIATAQLAIYFLPTHFQKVVYKYILRR